MNLSCFNQALVQSKNKHSISCDIEHVSHSLKEARLILVHAKRQWSEYGIELREETSFYSSETDFDEGGVLSNICMYQPHICIVNRA